VDYQKHYNRLIEKAQQRTLTEEYVESHHIIPKCIGGSNLKSNLVDLTPEEHFVAHQLLVKIYPGEPKLIYACMLMTVSNQHLHRSLNKVYGWIKRKNREVRQGRNVGDNNPSKRPEVRQKISDAIKGRQRSESHNENVRIYREANPPTVEQRQRMGAPHKGIPLSQEQKDKIGKTHRELGTAPPSALGRKLSDETKKKISDAKKGKSQPSKGKPRSEETKRKISESVKTRYKEKAILSDAVIT
jgi:hypothetical protein